MEKLKTCPACGSPGRKFDKKIDEYRYSQPMVTWTVEKYVHCTRCTFTASHKHWQAERPLENSFEKYGNHLHNCKARENPDYRCTCGFENVLSEINKDDFEDERQQDE